VPSALVPGPKPQQPGHHSTNKARPGWTPTAPATTLSRWPAGDHQPCPDANQRERVAAPGRPKVVVLMPPPVPGAGTMPHQGHHQSILLPISPPPRAATCLKAGWSGYRHRLKINHYISATRQTTSQAAAASHFGEEQAQGHRDTSPRDQRSTRRVCSRSLADALHLERFNQRSLVTVADAAGHDHHGEIPASPPDIAGKPSRLSAPEAEPALQVGADAVKQRGPEPLPGEAIVAKKP